MTNRAIILAALGTAALFLGGCGTDELACEDNGNLSVCGDVGAHLYSTKLATPGVEVRWPPVALADGRLLLARGSDVLELSAKGQVKVGLSLPGPVGVLSRGADGTVVASATLGGSQMQVVSFTPASPAASSRAGDVRWTKTMAGSPAIQPAGRTAQRVFVARRTTAGQPSGVVKLNADSGDVVGAQTNVSPVALLADGSRRQLHQARPCGSFRTLVATDANNAKLWSYDEAQDGGIVDFAPGQAGEVYIVTEARTLRRISKSGAVSWSFTAPCADCTVAAAPTVTKTRIYFPVWKGGDWSCSKQSTWTPSPLGLDPLYALRHDGTIDWVYDGFAAGGSRFNPTGIVPLSSTGSPVESKIIMHHPSGRPTVAGDGTLYVAADGGMATLSARGVEIGRVVYDAAAGEHITDGHSLLKGTSSSLVGSAAATPVLAADGTLYMWDGESVHAFASGRALAKAPWIAPFGGPNNASAVAE